MPSAKPVAMQAAMRAAMRDDVGDAGGAERGERVMSGVRKPPPFSPRDGTWVVWLLVGCAGEGERREVAAAPQVLLVTLDTLAAGRVGCYGGPVATPHLDSLAVEGTLFARASVPMPQTAPSHAALLTGRAPFSHGLTDNWHSLAPEVDTAAELLARHGVATGCFYNVFEFREANLVQGFERQVRDRSDLATDVVRSCLAWLDELPADRPSFAWLHLFIAHTPLVPPEPHRSRHVTLDATGVDFSVRARLDLLRSGGLSPSYAQAFRELYDAEVAFLDQRFGELLAGLRERGRLDRTLLLVLADHGESLLDRTLGLHAFVATQETLRVPFLARGPGVRSGAVVEPIVEAVDVLPTLLESFGIARAQLPGELAERLDGESLWPLLRGDPDPLGSGDEPVAFGSLPCTPPAPGALPEAERLTAWQGRFKLVVAREEGGERELLYDVEADPLEERDVATAHPDVVRGLRRKLDAWVERTAGRRAPAGGLSRSGQEMLQQLGYGER